MAVFGRVEGEVGFDFEPRSASGLQGSVVAPRPDGDCTVIGQSFKTEPEILSEEE